MRFAFFIFLLSTACFAAPTTLRVVDGSGAPVKDVLVVVKSLDAHYSDVSRQLTDDRGRIRTLEMKDGLYRAIAITPYGLWETAIKEFLVRGDPVELTLKVIPHPTHGYGDIVPVRTARGEIQVLMPDGSPASGAKVLARDENATLQLERWYQLDKDGKSKVELVAQPTVLVIICSNKLFTTQLAPNQSHAIIRFTPN